MFRERALKAVLALVGLLFVAGIYLIARPPFEDETFRMMLSVYVGWAFSCCWLCKIPRSIEA